MLRLTMSAAVTIQVGLFGEPMGGDGVMGGCELARAAWPAAETDRWAILRRPVAGAQTISIGIESRAAAESPSCGAGQAGGRVGPLGFEDKTPLAGLFSGQLGECLAAPRG